MCSSQADVQQFLCSSSLALTEHQEGQTRVFMRESQRVKLDTLLHQTILSRILFIQRWYRAHQQRRTFLAMRAAVTRIQVTPCSLFVKNRYDCSLVYVLDLLLYVGELHASECPIGILQRFPLLHLIWGVYEFENTLMLRVECVELTEYRRHQCSFSC